MLIADRSGLLGPGPATGAGDPVAQRIASSLFWWEVLEAHLAHNHRMIKLNVSIHSGARAEESAMGVGVFRPINFPVAFGSPTVAPRRPWPLAVRSVLPDELQDVPRHRSPRRVNDVREAQGQR